MATAFCKIILVCGYTKTGKDTVCNQFSRSSSIPFNWNIYKNSFKRDIRDLILNHTFIRRASADAVKKSHCSTYNLDINMIEEEKDKLFIDGKTHRDFLKELATIERSKYIDVWINKSTSDLVYDHTSKNIVVITDWRFENEWYYVYNMFPPDSIITIRLFSPIIPIPDQSIISEHELDNWTTDYIFVRDGDLNDVVMIFPQYENFTLIK